MTRADEGGGRPENAEDDRRDDDAGAAGLGCGGVRILPLREVAVESMVEEKRQCPDCGGEMVIVKKGWECLNPSCDMIQISIKRGHGWKETRVTRRTTVIKGEEAKEAETE